MRKFLSLFAVTCCMVLSIMATPLKDGAVITIGDTQITAENKDNVEDPNLSQGKVSYDDATHTLTLDDAYIYYTGSPIVIDASAVNADIIIKVKGVNGQIYGVGAAPLHLKAAAAGKGLVFDGNKNASINFFTSATGDAAAIFCRKSYSDNNEEDFFPVTFKGGVIVSARNDFADGGYAVSCHHIVLDGAKLDIMYAGGAIEAKVPAENVFNKVIESAPFYDAVTYDYYTKDYPVWIAGKRLNDKFYDYYGSGLSSGSITYNDETRTLSLYSAKLSYASGDAAIVINDEDDKTTPIKVVFEGWDGQVNGGTNTHAFLCETPVIFEIENYSYSLNATTSALKHKSTLTIQGGGTLKFSASGAGSYGIHGEGANAKLIIDGTNVWANGKEACIYEPAHQITGVAFSEPDGFTWDDSETSPKNGSDIVKNTDLKFLQNEYTFAANSVPAEGGKVVLKVGDELAEVALPYKHNGSYVSYTLEAVPNSGYAFGYWGNDWMDNNPVKTGSLFKYNDKFVANFAYNVAISDPLYAVVGKDIQAFASNLMDEVTTVATIDAANEVKGVGYFDGKIYYFDDDGSSATFYSAEFTPDQTTKLQPKQTVVPSQNEFVFVSAITYNETEQAFYVLANESATGQNVLCTIKDGVISKVMNHDFSSAYTLATDAADELYTIEYIDTKYWLVRIKVAEDDIEQIAKVNFYPSSLAMTYYPSIGQFVLINNEYPAKAYVLNPTTGEVEWAGLQDFSNDIKGLFATLAPKPKYNITVKSANESMGTVSPAGTKAYPEGSKITVTATPNKGYLFDKWSDGGEQTHEITVGNADATYTASFKDDPDMKMYPVWVGGVQVWSGATTITSAEYPAVTLGAAAYNPANNTLTLSAININATSAEYAVVIGPETGNGGNLNIELVGDNFISGYDKATVLIRNCNITVKGSGTLSVNTYYTANGIALDNADLTFDAVNKVEISANGFGIVGTGNETVTLRGTPADVKGGSSAGSIVGLADLKLEYCSITSPTGAEFANGQVEKSGAVVTDKIVIAADPATSAIAYQEGTGSFTIASEDKSFENVGWFKSGTDITITAQPAAGFAFARWMDDKNWKDEEKRMTEEREEKTTSADKEYKALFYKKANSSATWYGVNNGKFVAFEMADFAYAVTKAGSKPAAANVKAGDFDAYDFIYMDGTTLKKLPFSGIEEGEDIEGVDDIEELIKGLPSAITDMTYNFKARDMYAVAGSKLYILDYEDEMKANELGTFKYESATVSVVAIASNANGDMYVLAPGANAVLYTIAEIDEDNKEVTLELVGENGQTGVAATAEAQSMSFDRATGELLWGAPDYLYLINTDDAKAYIAGDLGQTGGAQKAIKAMHKKDATATITVKVADGQEAFGSASINGKEKAQVIVGTKATLVATANEGYHFVKWVRESNGNEYNTNPLSVTVNGKATYVAYFAEGQGIESVTFDPALDNQKLLIDGVMYIMHDGRIYTATGELVK